MKRLIILTAVLLVASSLLLVLLGGDRVPVDDLVLATEEFLEELNDYEELSLAVMITKNGVPVLEKAYGSANRSFDAPNRIDTKFNIASMNKMFTAVASMQLVQSGRLRLDDTIGDHIPDFPNEGIKKVTVYQLLTHTAGLGNIFGKEYGKTPVNRYQDVEDYFPLFVDEPLRFDPGSKYEYSNAGYIMLGHLIEKITGRDYYSYVRENIFAPAGMRDTDCYDVQYPVPNLAVGYTKSRNGSGEYRYKTIEYMKMTKGGPAGGGYSTVGDLLRFGEALFGNRLLDEEHTALATTGKVTVDDTYQGGEYCFGFLEQKINGHRIVGHSGNFSGIRSTLKIYVDDGISFAILSNVDRDQGAEELEYFIREHINGETEFTRSYLGTKKMIREIELAGLAGAMEEPGTNIDNSHLYESLIDYRGHLLLGRGEYEKAIDLLTFNTYAFPNSGRAHESLAEAYARAGDEENAARYRRKASDLEAKSASARE
jgi:D-alanyl-D-alanine carboxypeptidase